MNELTTLHEAITATIATGMPQLETVEAYGAVDENTALPALAYGITGMQPGIDAGDGRTCVLATFEALITLDRDVDQAGLQVTLLAAQLTELLNKQFWALSFVEGARNVEACRVAATADNLLHVAWKVQWQQVLYLGAAQWLWPDEPPGSAVFGFEPDTGPGNESHYVAPEDLA